MSKSPERRGGEYPHYIETSIVPSVQGNKKLIVMYVGEANQAPSKDMLFRNFAELPQGRVFDLIVFGSGVLNVDEQDLDSLFERAHIALKEDGRVQYTDTNVDEHALEAILEAADGFYFNVELLRQEDDHQNLKTEIAWLKAPGSFI